MGDLLTLRRDRLLTASTFAMLLLAQRMTPKTGTGFHAQIDSLRASFARPGGRAAL